MLLKGLTSKQADELLKKHGENTIIEQKKKSLLMKFLEQFNNVFTIILLVAAILSFIIGEPIDGGLIISIVILNAFFGLYQESKAEEAISALKKIVVTKIRVIRDGKEQEIDSKYLVPGDIFFIEEGVKIPADGKVIESMYLEINEAAMTGESLPVEKKQEHEIFMGTLVAKGRGYVRVESTGMNTKFGEIAKGISEISVGKTPLQKKLEAFSRTIGIVGIIVSAIVFGLSLINGSGYFPAFLLAISLAVAIVPEGLPAVMTITLSMGVKEMAKKKAIIRRLSSIEALGSVTLIATDKTGTITTNKMKVKEVYINQEKFLLEKIPSLNNHAFSEMITNGVLCSTASLVYIHDHGHFDVLGDPTEGALLYLAQNLGIKIEDLRNEWKIKDEISFDSVTKRMAVAVEKGNKKINYYKGAPESILEISDKILIGKTVETLSYERLEKIKETLSEWTKKGLRVLAFSYDSGVLKKNEKSQIFLGMVAIHDPPRIEVKEAIRRTREAGIKVVMITGDNEKTAESIGVSVGLMQKDDEILTGNQIDKYSDTELLKVLPKVKVFARTTPFHKTKIVQLYQQLGEIVAVTGDGVNDAIALKQADVGAAMGIVGTDVARETADMVVTDDNFASIVNAIEEGRNIIKNLKNAIQYLLSCNVAEAASLIVALLLGLPHLFFAVQLLYINLITDGFPALALSFSPRKEDAMKAPPDKKLELLQTFEKKYILIVGAVATILIITAYYIFSSSSSIIYGKTAAFCVLALIQSFIFIDLWLSHKPLRKNIKKLFNPIFIVAFSIPFITQFLIISVPFFAHLFKVEIVSISTFFYYIILSSLVLVGVKVIKKYVVKIH